MGLGNRLKEAATKGLKSAGGAAKAAAVQAAKNINPDKVKQLSEATLGKDTTKKIIDTGTKAHDAVEKTVGKERLDAAKKGALSASSVAVFASPKGMAIAGAAGALVGLATGRDVVGDIAKIFVGAAEDDTAQNGEAPKTPEAGKQDAGKDAPKADKPANTDEAPKAEVPRKVVRRVKRDPK